MPRYDEALDRVLPENVQFLALKRRYQSVWLRVVFLAWERTIVKKELVAYMAEAASLAQRLGKSKESIWSMKKADLVEVARKELGISAAQAQKDTVEILREKIRRVRAFKDSLDDPLAAVPVGLGKMKLEDLQDEANKRGLPVAPNATRVQLLMLIREDADHRIMRSAPTASAMAPAEDDDFEMVSASKAKAKPTPKSKGYSSASA